MSRMEPGELKLSQRVAVQSRGRLDQDTPAALIELRHAQLSALSRNQSSALAGALNVPHHWLRSLITHKRDATLALTTARDGGLNVRRPPSVLRWLSAIALTGVASVAALLSLMFGSLSLMALTVTLFVAAGVLVWPSLGWRRALTLQAEPPVVNPIISALRLTLRQADLAAPIESDMRDLLDNLEQNDVLSPDELSAELARITALLQPSAAPDKRAALKHSAAALRATQQELR